MGNPRKQRLQMELDLGGNSSSPSIQRIGGKRISPNIAILGENLLGLQSLRQRFGTPRRPFEVDIIAIDPPYNVGGNQGYRNVWKGESNRSRSWAGSHGAFLDFMEPRLRLAKEVLSECGVIYVNICDGEYPRLKILMDEVFGEANCLGTIIWNKVQGAYGKHLTDVHEYILVYGRDFYKAPRLNKAKESALLMIGKAQELKKNKVPHEEAKRIFKEWVRDSLGAGLIGKSESYYDQLHPETFEPFQATSMSAQDNPDSRFKGALIHPVTRRPCKVPPMGWKYSEQTLKEMAKYSRCYQADGFIVAGEIRYGLDESTIPRQAFPLREGMFHALPSVITISHNQGKKDLPKGIEFTTPKPVGLIKELIRVYPNKDARVLDFFGGSGTTAHAVIEANAEDGGKRSWILIEEMASTFNRVLIPRISAVDSTKDFTIFQLKQSSRRTSEEIQASLAA